MSLLSRVIKSVAVVEDHPDKASLALRAREIETAERAVIKKRILTGGQPPTAFQPAPIKDALLEELNRVRIQIEEAQRELDLKCRRIEDINEEIDGLEQQREALKEFEGLTIDDQAKAILMDAENKAKRTLEEARQQATETIDQLKAQGYLDGLEQGASEAHTRYNAEHEPDIKKLECLMTTLSAMKDDLAREYENDMVNLIIAVAEKIIGKTLKDDPKVVVDMLREVMEQNRRESYIKVTLSPDLLPATAKVSENIRKMIQELGQQVDVAVDTEAGPGTMMVETSGGFTDLSVPTQLYNLNEAFLQD